MSLPSPLRLQLDRYVRSLLERSDHPEQQQDLGTFLTWLLGRMGFTLRLLPFHFAGPERRVSKGRFQGGIDLVASHQRDDGAEDLYLFVLKRGDIGRPAWKSEDGMRADLAEVGDTTPEMHGKWLPPDSKLGRVVVVAAHNGELDMERLAEKRRTIQQRFERDGFGFEWWSAVELVDRALGVLGKGVSDDQLFPPMVRPFYGVLLDDLGTSGRIRSDAIDRLLDARLPPGEALSQDDLLRALTELSLFAAMLASMDEEQSRGLLELLDALVRLITRCMANVVDAGETSAPVRGALVELLGTFVGAGDRLADILDPIIGIPDGLALMRDSECIDWPLRTVRMVRDLMLTTRVAKDLAKYYVGQSRRAKDDTERRAFKERADELHRLAERSVERSTILAEHNWGGMATPITDDQLVEYAIIWRTWLEHGKTELAKALADQMLSRLVLRRYLRFPGPALYLSAGTPMPEDQARLLAEAWSGLRPVELEDRGSTLIPVVLLVAWRLGVQVEETAVAKFGDIHVGERHLSPVHLQSCTLPEDAPRRWYGTSLRRAGVGRIHENDKLAPFLAQFARRQLRLHPSPASTLGLSSIDVLAWVRWRTRPPLHWILDVLPEDRV